MKEDSVLAQEKSASIEKETIDILYSSQSSFVPNLFGVEEGGKA